MWEVHGGYGGQNDGLDELGMMGREGRREGGRKGVPVADDAHGLPRDFFKVDAGVSGLGEGGQGGVGRGHDKLHGLA